MARDLRQMTYDTIVNMEISNDFFSRLNHLGWYDFLCLFSEILDSDNTITFSLMQKLTTSGFSIVLNDSDDFALNSIVKLGKIVSLAM